MSKVFITGGIGLVGRNLIERMTKRDSITIYDNGSKSPRWHLEDLPTNVCIARGDIRDFNFLVSAMADNDTIIHLAAFGSVVESVSAPEVNFEHNVFGTFNVLRAAKEVGVTKVIMASTGGALIGEAEPPVNEQSLPKPISPYGASKLCGEAYCHAFAKAYSLNTVALRFANVYGPYSAHKKGAVTAFIKAIMRGEPMVIYGDGSATRDFLYVGDLCDGICRAIETELPPGEVLHLASGVETSVLELAKLVATVAGVPDYPVEFRLPRPAEVSRNFARYDRAREKLGFEPEWSLREGLDATWQWFRVHGLDMAV